jgi:serine/threonine protein phosphatase PrpC
MKKTYLIIKKRNSRDKIIHKEKIELINTSPILSISDHYYVPSLVLASACVLPGKDPRDNIHKVCRDFCFMSCEDLKIIGGVYDGHGKEGERVVSYCISETDYFFTTQINQYDDMQLFLEHLIHYLELQLQDCSGIDITNSGTTCTVFILSNNTVYTTCLGCNRAVLGTRGPANELQKRSFSFKSNFEYLSEISKVRRKTLTSSLSSFQLSIDHKPENPCETHRIVSKGGKIKKLTDKYGNFYGPYKIFLNSNDSNSLTVSRCLGNTMMKDIGVSSTPQTTKHIIQQQDQFLIIGSDGIWKVLTTTDAVDFVESHRDVCLKGMSKPTYSDIITPNNTSIAQLLCEEARVRWLAKVENEDVVIDDITCIILEIKNKNNLKSSTQADLLKSESTVEKENLELVENVFRTEEKKCFDDVFSGRDLINSKY